MTPLPVLVPVAAAGGSVERARALVCFPRLEGPQPIAVAQLGASTPHAMCWPVAREPV
jgi:hypothetical protein